MLQQKKPSTRYPRALADFVAYLSAILGVIGTVVTTNAYLVAVAFGLSISLYVATRRPATHMQIMLAILVAVCCAGVIIWFQLVPDKHVSPPAPEKIEMETRPAKSSLRCDLDKLLFPEGDINGTVAVGCFYNSNCDVYEAMLEVLEHSGERFTSNLSRLALYAYSAKCYRESLIMIDRLPNQNQKVRSLREWRSLTCASRNGNGIFGDEEIAAFFKSQGLEPKCTSWR